jgi:hypothetical protein
VKFEVKIHFFDKDEYMDLSKWVVGSTEKEITDSIEKYVDMGAVAAIRQDNETFIINWQHVSYVSIKKIED